MWENPPQLSVLDAEFQYLAIILQKSEVEMKQIR
jgi:hypothetical protein